MPSGGADSPATACGLRIVQIAVITIAIGLGVFWLLALPISILQGWFNDPAWQGWAIWGVGGLIIWPLVFFVVKLWTHAPWEPPVRGKGKYWR